MVPFNLAQPTGVPRNVLPVRPNPKGPSVLSGPTNYTMLRRPLPCVLNTKVGRLPPAPASAALQPVTGIARGQRKGLGYMPQHPLDGKLLPRAGFYFPGMTNSLGQPK